MGFYVHAIIINRCVMYHHHHQQTSVSKLPYLCVEGRVGREAQRDGVARVATIAAVRARPEVDLRDVVRCAQVHAPPRVGRACVKAKLKLRVELKLGVSECKVTAYAYMRVRKCVSHRLKLVVEIEGHGGYGDYSTISLICTLTVGAILTCSVCRHARTVHSPAGSSPPSCVCVQLPKL